MQVMNWKNNTLGRISIEIKCVLFSGKDKSSPREKKKKTRREGEDYVGTKDNYMKQNVGGSKQ